MYRFCGDCIAQICFAHWISRVGDVGAVLGDGDVAGADAEVDHAADTKASCAVAALGTALGVLALRLNRSKTYSICVQNLNQRELYNKHIQPNIAIVQRKKCTNAFVGNYRIFTAVMQDPESPLVALQGRCRNWTKLQDKKSTTAVPLQMFHNCFKIGKLYLNMGKNFPSLLLSPTDMALMAAAVSVSLGWRGEEEGEEGWRN